MDELQAAILIDWPQFDPDALEYDTEVNGADFIDWLSPWLRTSAKEAREDTAKRLGTVEMMLARRNELGAGHPVFQKELMMILALSGPVVDAHVERTNQLAGMLKELTDAANGKN